MADDESEDDHDSNDDGNDPESKARKRKDRLEQNRISARESRKRKKTMIEELQRTVITLSRDNKELNDRNEALRRELMEIGAKYPNVVPLQAIVGQGAALQGPSGAVADPTARLNDEDVDDSVPGDGSSSGAANV
ncbi:hypothetical protein FisN_13Hh281 [Fistulifera solaris]|uniref:BZIP domain-containing protein n=1 Tax=Fistulifera solaris TaxID=1519565 RepID=A0A1Z5KNW7_FISSO|nr:hypothetical protein FisN_13Hh281 [Fistulifera solaris]|eukprot:GAX27628.1 hypothetical protein FisN_13Hh281 [Fistulifera solaris]